MSEVALICPVCEAPKLLLRSNKKAEGGFNGRCSGCGLRVYSDAGSSGAAELAKAAK